MVHRPSSTHVALYVCGFWLLAVNARGAEEPCPSLERLLPNALATGLGPAKADFFRARLCPAEDAGAVDPQGFAEAVDVSSAWIRAMLTDSENVPDLESRVVGVVRATKGRDATIKDFTTDSYHIVAIQTTETIGMLLAPIDRQGAGRAVRPSTRETTFGR